METVIQAVRGDNLDTTNSHCIFCGKIDDTKLFGVIPKKMHDGHLLKTYPACNEHLSRIDALLSGEFDIDKINLDEYRKPARKAVRFRG